MALLEKTRHGSTAIWIQNIQAMRVAEILSDLNSLRVCVSKTSSAHHDEPLTEPAGPRSGCSTRLLSAKQRRAGEVGKDHRQQSWSGDPSQNTLGLAERRRSRSTASSRSSRPPLWREGEASGRHGYGIAGCKSGGPPGVERIGAKEVSAAGWRGRLRPQ